MIIQFTHQTCSCVFHHSHLQRHLTTQLCRLTLHYDVIFLQMHKDKQYPQQFHCSIWPKSRRLWFSQCRHDMQPEQHSEPNSSLNSVSFECSAVAFKLFFNCSSGFVRPNSAWMFDKSCVSTSKVFNISDWDFWQALDAFYQLGNWASRRSYFKFRFRFHTTSTLSLKNLFCHKLLPHAKRSVPYRVCLWTINNLQTRGPSYSLHIPVVTVTILCCPSLSPHGRQFLLWYLSLKKMLLISSGVCSPLANDQIFSKTSSLNFLLPRVKLFVVNHLWLTTNYYIYLLELEYIKPAPTMCQTTQVCTFMLPHIRM